jgi:uroporphyrinogen-III decarboxylase
MTKRERYLAAVSCRPVDRIPFWPKVFGGYLAAQRPPFSALSVDRMFDWFDAEPQYNAPEHIVRVGADGDCVHSRKEDLFITVFSTPHGQCRTVSKANPVTLTSHPVEFPVKTVEDIRIMTGWYEAGKVRVDGGALEKQAEFRRRVGDKGPLAYFIGESPLMHFVEHLAGIENAHYFLADQRAEVEALFHAMHRDLLDRTVLACENPHADLLYFAENTSTTLVSPEQYERYCTPHIEEYGKLVNRSGKPMVLHMCGHLKKLLPILARNRADAFEAFTSPSVGNTTLADGRAACPAKGLIGGTNAVTWLKSAQEIIEEIEESLSVLPRTRGLVLSSAGVTPPAAKPETIAEVIRWLKSYPVRN